VYLKAVLGREVRIYLVDYRMFYGAGREKLLTSFPIDEIEHKLNRECKRTGMKFTWEGFDIKVVECVPG
jgi:hypothetical protein